VVALVRGVHGLNGALRVEVLTDRPEARFKRGATLFVEGSEAPLRVIEGVPVADGPGWRIRLAEAPDRKAAEAYRGAYLEALVPVEGGAPGADSWLWHEVVGLAVLGRDGEELGTVTDIYRVAENDVYVVHGPRGEFDVPAVRDFVVSLEPRDGALVVDAVALDLPPVRPVRPFRAARPRKGDAARSIAAGIALSAAEAGAAAAQAVPDSEGVSGEPAADVDPGTPAAPATAATPATAET
jgi:16S rRNA processing protein RimM